MLEYPTIQPIILNIYCLQLFSGQYSVDTKATVKKKIEIILSIAP